MMYFATGILVAIGTVVYFGKLTVDLVSGGFIGGLLAWQLLRWLRSGAMPFVAACQLSLFFLRDLVKNSLILARDVLRPRPNFSPAILALDTASLRPAEATALAVMLSLIPGSLAVSLNEKRARLFVFALYAADLEQAKKDLLLYANKIKRLRMHS